MVRSSDWLYAEVPFGLVNTTVAIVWFLYRRRMFPIHGRHLSMICFFAVLGIFEIYVEDWYAFTDNFCSWLQIVGLILTVMLLILLILRAFRLWFLFSLASEKLNMHKNVPRWEEDTRNLYDPGHPESQNQTINPPELRKPPTDTWFIRHRRYISDRNLWKAFFALSLIPVAVLLIGFGVFSITRNGVWDRTDDHCMPIEYARYFVWVFVVLSTSSLAFLVWKIRHINDGYGIRNEVLWIIIITLTTVALLTVTEGIEKVVLHLIPEQLQLIPMFYYPIYLSYKEQRYQERKRQEALDSKRKRSSISFDTSLMQVLTQREFSEARKSFEAHLVREFSIENIIFFKVTLQFEKCFSSMSEEKIREAALQIYLEFLVDRAPYQVNLPFNIRRDLNTNVRSYFIDFDEVAAEYKERRAKAGDTINVLNIRLGVPGVPLSITPKDLSIVEDAAGNITLECANPAAAALEAMKNDETQGTEKSTHNEERTQLADLDSDGELVEMKVIDSVPDTDTELPTEASENADHQKEAEVTSHDEANVVNIAESAAITSVDRFVFRTARESILTLMESDTFVRWKNQWRKEQEALAKEDAEAEARRESSSKRKQRSRGASSSKVSRAESSTRRSSFMEVRKKPEVTPV